MRRVSDGNSFDEHDRTTPGVPAFGSRLAGSNRLPVLLALLAVYLIWGSTYLAIRVAIGGIPPLLMGGGRFLLAGIILIVLLCLRGESIPATRQWGASAVIGAFLLVGGMGSVAYAEKQVASGLAATMIATTPLWIALFGRIFGHRSTRLELAGLALGFFGVVLLNLEHGLRANPLDAAILLFASASWAFGSLWSGRLPLPSGLMATATEMLTGGALLVLLGLAAGERLPTSVDVGPLLAFIYLIVIGSLVAFSAYNYLLQNVRPALATSYAYINPVVAVALGVVLAGEHIGIFGLLALAGILAGVAMVLAGRGKDQAGASSGEPSSIRR